MMNGARLAKNYRQLRPVREHMHMLYMLCGVA